jgi:hypothetical protein
MEAIKDQHNEYGAQYTAIKADGSIGYYDD